MQSLVPGPWDFGFRNLGQTRKVWYQKNRPDNMSVEACSTLCILRQAVNTGNPQEKDTLFYPSAGQDDGENTPSLDHSLKINPQYIPCFSQALEIENDKDEDNPLSKEEEDLEEEATKQHNLVWPPSISKTQLQPNKSRKDEIPVPSLGL